MSFVGSHSGFGAGGFGAPGFTYPREYTYTFLSRPVFGTRRRVALGWGAYGSRVWGRPETYQATGAPPGVSQNGTIQISSASGALVQVFRTDVRQPIIADLEFSDSKDGSTEFMMALHRLPPFPLLPFSMVQIKLGDTDFSWYTAIINYPDTGGNGIVPERQREGPYRFTGQGLRQYLDSIEAHAVFTTGTDLAEVVAEIAQDWIAPFSPIQFNDDKITADAGVPLTEDIDLSRHPIAKALEILGDMAKCRWGVDGDGDFFFLPFEEDPSAHYFVGHDFHGWLPRENMDSVVNYWLLTRQGASGEDKAGWNVGGVFEDPPSQSKYGFKKKQKSFPGSWADETFDVAGASLLESSKDPTPAATCTNWRIPLTGLRHIPIGRCYVIERVARTWTVFDDLDDESIWTANVPVDAEESEDLLMWSSASITFDHPGAEAESESESVSESVSDSESPVIVPTVAYMFKELSFFGKIVKMAFYLRSTITGSLGVYGVGSGAWNDHTQPLASMQAGQFTRVEFDIEKALDDGLDNLRYFGLMIDSVDPCTIHVDRFEVLVLGSRWLNLQVDKVKYKPVKREIEAEMGATPPSLPSFLRGLLANSSDLTYSQEQR